MDEELQRVPQTACSRRIEWPELLGFILHDRDRYYMNKEYGPYRLIFGRGVDPTARYSPVQDITFAERVAMIGDDGVVGGDPQFLITYDRRLSFLYYMEPVPLPV